MNCTHSVRQTSSDSSDNLQVMQEYLKVRAQSKQYPSRSPAPANGNAAQSREVQYG